MNEKVFYKSPSGVMVYDGAVPYKISEELGDARYFDAAAGACGGKYYIAMSDYAGKRSVFVYGTENGLWHKEDCAEPVRMFVGMNGRLFSLCEISDEMTEKNGMRGYIIKINDAAAAADGSLNIFGEEDGPAFFCEKEKSVEWFAESGLFGFSRCEKDEILRRLIVNLTLDDGAEFSLSVKAGENGVWQRVGFMNTPAAGSFSFPVNSKPCSRFALKFEGRGGCRISSVICLRDKAGEVKGIV